MNFCAQFISCDKQQKLINKLRLDLNHENKTSHSDDGGQVLHARERSPDSVILTWCDEEHPNGADLDCLRNVTPHLKLILVFGQSSRITLQEAYAIGVRGCLTHDADLNETMRAIHTVRSGGIHLPNGYAVPTATRLGPDDKPFTDAPLDPLTPAQQRILRSICDGLSNKEIARQHRISVGTVKNHVTAILAVLKLQRRQQLIVRFRHHFTEEGSR